MKAEKIADFPALQQRFDELHRELVPAFTRHDEQALMAQRTYRRFQLALIVGAALTSFFGAVQAALGSDVRWAAALVAVLGVATTYTSGQLRREHLPTQYLVDRAKAEELRSLYFNYLSGVELADVRGLETRVADIGYPREPDDDPARAPNTDDDSAADER